jgi:hypothetical protein
MSATIRWFGESWDAPICDPELHIEVPVGMICFGHDHMHEGRTVEIMPSDQGVTMPYVREDRTVGRCAYHLDCWLHEVGADRLR